MPTFEQFTKLADYYDRLMRDVPYSSWVDYVQSILERLGSRPKTVLDVACGTGNVTEELYDRGYEIVGVDVAGEMIEVAKRKALDSGRRIEYHVQDISDLDLGRQFDLVVSLFDSLNYVTDPGSLARGISRVFTHLSPSGLFIFDVNTEYALANHYFDQSSLEWGRDPRYVWTSYYDSTTRICRIDMVFEVQESGGKRQFTEVHHQRAYSLEELSAMLETAGFDVEQVYHAYSFRKPTAHSDRVFFVARRPAG